MLDVFESWHDRSVKHSWIATSHYVSSWFVHDELTSGDVSYSPSAVDLGHAVMWYDRDSFPHIHLFSSMRIEVT